MRKLRNSFIHCQLSVANFPLSILQCLLAVLLVSCKPSVPGKYLQPDEMEDVIYDIHLAQGMTKDTLDANVYCDAVLKKYGISRADYDSSMVYYYRHTDLMNKIYANLLKRFEGQVDGAGGSSSGQIVISQDGDNVDVWNQRRRALLVPQMPYNRLSYKVDADTTFHPGDKVMLEFDARFLFQDGMKDGVAMLALRFKNDSVASRVIHLSSSSSYTLQITDEQHVGIKEIQGFIYLGEGGSSSSTLRLMILDKLRLLRMHEQQQKKNVGNAERSDSDSLHAPSPNSINKRQALNEKDSMPLPRDREAEITL